MVLQLPGKQPLLVMFIVLKQARIPMFSMICLFRSEDDSMSKICCDVSFEDLLIYLNFKDLHPAKFNRSPLQKSWLKDYFTFWMAALRCGNVHPLKMGSWETIQLPFGGPPNFRSSHPNRCKPMETSSWSNLFIFYLKFKKKIYIYILIC